MFVAGVTSSRVEFVTEQGHVMPLTYYGNWPLIVFGLAAMVLGAWAFVSTFDNCIPFPGKSDAQSVGCDPRIKKEHDPNFIGAVTSLQPPNSVVVKGVTIVYIDMENVGGTATFSAEFDNVENAVHLNTGTDMPGYFGSIAWEDTDEPRRVIGPRGKARLVAMFFWQSPKIFGHFEHPFMAMWAPPGQSARKQMSGRPLGLKDATKPLEFDVRILNESKRTEGQWHAKVHWRTIDGTVTAVSLLPIATQ